MNSTEKIEFGKLGLSNDISKWKSIGRGGFSDIYIASYEKKPVAVKVLRDASLLRKNSSFLAEIEALRFEYFQVVNQKRHTTSKYCSTIWNSHSTTPRVDFGAHAYRSF